VLVESGTAPEVGRSEGDLVRTRTAAASLCLLVIAPAHASAAEPAWAAQRTKTAVYATPAGELAQRGPRAGDSDGAHERTLAILQAHAPALGMDRPREEFQLARVDADDLGMTHVRLTQSAHGFPVVGHEALVHYAPDGRVMSIASTYIAGLANVAHAPAISADVAGRTAMDDVASGPAGSPREGLFVASAPLVVDAPEAGRARLAYAVHVRSHQDPLVTRTIVVDAARGAVLRREDHLEAYAGLGQGVLGDQKPIEIEATDAGIYRLVDRSRTPAGIVTVDARGQQELPGDYIVSTSPVAGWDPAGVDAHYYGGLVYDYFKHVHLRAGIDGSDGQIVSTVHYGQGFNNAFWNGEQMIYGDGDGQAFRGFAAGLDVIAHELTHGVTQHSSLLAYEGENGALNESISDIFGCIVEHAFLPDPVDNWVIAERIALGTKGRRDFRHPWQSGPRQPTHMTEFVRTQTDNGGVHVNSGIPNNAMYLMTMGGTNDVSGVTVPAGIGWEKAAGIWYRANEHYFMQGTDFVGAAHGTLQAAKDLLLTPDEQAVIECAWIAVGILSGTCRSVHSLSPTLDGREWTSPSLNDGSMGSGSGHGRARHGGCNASGDLASTVPDAGELTALGLLCLALGCRRRRVKTTMNG
jgi:thermolysin